MNYEKSHNLLLHTIHYNLKKLNDLYRQSFHFKLAHEQAYAFLVDYYLNHPEEKMPIDYENFSDESSYKIIKGQWNTDCSAILDLLYPVLPLARENFPQFKYLFDWIEQSKPEGSISLESCWCLGCKQNRLIQFKDMPAYKEDNQIINKLMKWANERFDYSDQVSFIFKELCDGYQASEVKIIYGEFNDHDTYNFNETITHANINEVMAKHHHAAKWWFDRRKYEEMLRARNTPIQD